MTSLGETGVGPGLERGPAGKEATPGIRRLLENPQRLNTVGLWRALRPEDRVSAVRSYLEEGEEDREEIVAVVAGATRSRPDTVRRWPDRKLASHMSAPVPLEPSTVTSLFFWLHFSDRRAMLRRFFDLLGISSGDETPEDFRQDVSAPAEAVHRAGEILVAEYGLHDTAVYVLYLMLRRVSITGELHSWLSGLTTKALPEESVNGDRAKAGETGPAAEHAGAPVGELSAKTDQRHKVEQEGSRVAATVEQDTAAAAGGTDGDAGVQGSGAGSPARQPEPARPSADGDAGVQRSSAAPVGLGPSPTSFTTLDHLLKNAALDSAQGVLGSLSGSELSDAVNEFIRLNGRRPISFFHAGYRDSLFRRSHPKELPGQDRDRARWYWTGAIQGWARSESWPAIVREYRNRSVVRELGDGSDRASDEAVECLVQALRTEGRKAEVAHFVKVPAVARSPRLFEILLEVATELVCAADAAQAKPVLDLLTKAADEMKEQGVELQRNLVLEATRRRAHCLRQLDENERARTILEGLLTQDPDCNVRAMVHADLGLIAGGFRWLSAVRLPSARKDLSGTLDKIEKGFKHFRKSIGLDVPYAAHGHYCLGVLALGRAVEENAAEDAYRNAARHLEQARAHFLADSQRYFSGLVRQSCLYFATATTLALSPERLARGTRIMAAAIESGAEFAPYLIKQTMEALDLADVEDLCRVSGAILGQVGDAALDALAKGPAVGKCMLLTEKLRERAGRPDRTHADAASDLRSALIGYRISQDYQTAAEVLDELEQFAVHGVGLQEFAEILQKSDACYPWSVEDARVALARCREAQGRYPEATQVLQSLFYLFTTDPVTDKDLDDAAGVLERIRRYGIDSSYYQHLQNRYTALTSTIGSEEPEEPSDNVQAPVKVLVVGGNEVQARHEKRIRSSLARSHPHIDVTFLRTGWGSNWQKPLEEVQRRLPIHDAVVIMRFMRTGLGKRIREECGPVPWRFCWSGGPNAQVKTIIRAARVAEAASPSWRIAATVHDSVRSAVRELCARFGNEYWRRADEQRAYPEEFVAALTEAGYLACLIPEEYGGAGLGMGDACVIMEEINRSGANSAACHAQMYTMGILLRHGSEEQKRRFLPKIASGTLRLQAFAVTEPDAGSDTTRIRTFAERRGDRYVVTGQKVFISRVRHSDLMVLLARTTPRDNVEKRTRGLSVFLVDLRDTGGAMRVKPIETMINHESSEVFFDGLEVPAENRIGEEGRGFRYIISGMNAERILLASESIGDGLYFVCRASSYARDRRVFGRPIGANQGVQFPIADAYMQVRAAAAMRDQAAALYDAGENHGAEANMAKYLSSRAAWKAGNVAMDTFGGWGMAAEYGIERKFRESRLYLVAPVANNLVLSHVACHVLGLPRSF